MVYTVTSRVRLMLLAGVSSAAISIVAPSDARAQAVGGGTVSGTATTAVGTGSQASGTNTTAVGTNATATTSTSTAGGQSAAATAANATAVGQDSSAVSAESTAIGGLSVASGVGSVASGYGLCVSCAIRVAATRALRLWQCSVDLLVKQWVVWRGHPAIVGHRA